MNKPLAEVFRYNKWATERLLDACRDLTDEQLDTHPSGLSGSIRELLMHVVGGQQSQVLRTKGRQHEGELTRRSDWPGFDQLMNLAQRSSEELIEIAQTLDQDHEVLLPYMAKTYTFPLSFFLVHALEHGVEHRTEIKVGLNQLGFETPDLDGWSYSTAAGYGRVVS